MLEVHDDFLLHPHENFFFVVLLRRKVLLDKTVQEDVVKSNDPWLGDGKRLCKDVYFDLVVADVLDFVSVKFPELRVIFLIERSNRLND